MTRHIRRVEPMHFGCVELVEQHSSTRSTRRARLAQLARQSRTCRVVTSRVETSQVEFGPYSRSLHRSITQRLQYKLAVTVHRCNRYTALQVSRQLLRVGLRSFRLPTSPFSQPSQTEYSAVSSQHIWHHPGFLSRRSDGLELTARFVP